MAIQAQDKTYEFGFFQIKYPANFQLFTLNKGGSTQTFIISAVLEDGSEQRMKVIADWQETRTDLTKYSKWPSRFVTYLGYNPRYVNVEMEMNGEGNGFYYADSCVSGKSSGRFI